VWRINFFKLGCHVEASHSN
jgi:hypothetical protein